MCEEDHIMTCWPRAQRTDRAPSFISLSLRELGPSKPAQLLVQAAGFLMVEDCPDPQVLGGGELLRAEAVVAVGPVELFDPGRHGPLGRERGQLVCDPGEVDPVVTRVGTGRGRGLHT